MDFLAVEDKIRAEKPKGLFGILQSFPVSRATRSEGCSAVNIRDRIRCSRIHVQAEGYLELGMPQQALELLRQLPGRSGMDSYGLYLRATALQGLGRCADALVPLRQAAQIVPEDIRIWLAMGWCWKRTGRLDLALEALEQAARVDPDEAIVHYNLACYLSLIGDKNRCLKHLAQALVLDPGYREFVEDESDFDRVRSDPEFQALTSLIA